MDTASNRWAARISWFLHSPRAMFAAVLAALVAYAALDDLSLGLFGIVLVCCYVGSLYLLVPVRLFLMVFPAALASLPWFGLGFPFYSPWTLKFYPHLELPGFLESCLSPIYDYVAEGPLWAVVRMAEATGSLKRLDHVYSFSKSTMFILSYSVFVFWTGIALAFLLSALTSVIATRARCDGSRSQWLPSSGFRVLVRNTALLAVAISAAMFALLAAYIALGAKAGYSNSTIAVGQAVWYGPIAVLAALAIAYHLRGPLPRLFSRALLGGLLGVLLAAQIDSHANYPVSARYASRYPMNAHYAQVKPAGYPRIIGLVVPAGLLVGAASGAALCWLPPRRRRAAGAAAA